MDAMKYFTECRTIEDVKAAFKELAKKLHPDNGGNEAEFKAMMQEYETAFNRYKNIHTAQDGTTYEKETTETPEGFAEIISKVIWMDGVKVEIIGSWIWLTGNTMHYKDEIKSAGFWWSKSKKAWYYPGETTHRKRRGNYSMDGLRMKWGSMEVEKEEKRRIDYTGPVYT